jgi:predicted O-methyltransferase YrrM
MKIIPEGFDFYASENGESKDKLILSLSGYDENLSKVPVTKGWDIKIKTETIFGILNEIVNSYDKLSKIPKNPQSLICILEIVGKFIKMCVQCHKPYKILELGAEQGLLSYFLTFVAREFNEKNMMHCVSGNLLSQEWFLLLHGYGNAAENLNLYITDSQTQALQENYFDFCVINNSEKFPNTDKILNNAIRLLKIGGILLFVSADGKVIEQKISPEQKQAAYRQTEEANTGLQKDEMKILLQNMEKRFAEIEKFTKEELCLIVKDLAYLEKLSIKLFADIEPDLKCELNAAKEKVLNILYAPSEELKDIFVSKIKEQNFSNCLSH